MAIIGVLSEGQCLCHRHWGGVALPHADVLQMAFRPSEFGAHTTAVYTRKTTREDQDGTEFFECTLMTEGMCLLFIFVARSLNS